MGRSHYISIHNSVILLSLSETHLRDHCFRLWSPNRWLHTFDDVHLVTKFKLNHIFFFQIWKWHWRHPGGFKNSFCEKLCLSRSCGDLKYLPHTLFLFCTKNCSNLQCNLLCGNWVLYFLQGSPLMAMLQLRIRPHPLTYPSTGRVYSFIALFIRFSHTLGKTAIHIFYCHFWIFAQ